MKQQHYLAVVTLTRDTAPELSLHEGIGNFGTRAETKRRLAEAAVSEFFAYENVRSVKSRWMGGDLFLSALIAVDGDENPEWSLAANAPGAAGRWGEYANAELKEKGIGNSWKGWKAGVGCVPSPTGRYKSDIAYEAAKRALLQVNMEGGAEQERKRFVFQRMLSEKTLFPHYQPIVNLAEGGGVFGFEALTRFPVNDSFQGPYELFRFAGEIGDAYRLDRVARDLAISGCASLGPGQKLFINVMAQIMEDPDFSPGRTIGLLERHHISPNQVVFEINERTSIQDYPAIKKVLEHYRSQGYQIAIDDMGAGYSSLQSVVELRPDYLKIDRSIIQNIHNDEVKAHILHTLQETGGKIGASLIAEGIELEEELAELKGMGIPYAQGYLMGKPAPFPLS
ncbi:EAL domain-containing protein [Paenibacillus sp. CAU 1782]